MSAQALNIMLVDLFRSDEKLAQYQQNPDSVTVNYDLTAEECERLKAKDMGWLYTHGAHPYILVQYAFAIKHDLGQYLQSLQAATGKGGPGH
jgi:aromatic-ring opening dioxygenase LigAB LigA subunit